jgi:SAM-dependent methyltransferase
VSGVKDRWQSGEPYERYVGRWSRLVAREFVDWLDVPIGVRWLDIGCGTGALTGVILERAAPSSVVGVDPSEGFVGHAQSRIDDQRAEFRVGDARELPVADEEADVAVAGLVLNFVPEPEKAVAEVRRALRPGGIAAAYVWDYAERMELMRHFWDAAAELDPDAAELDEGPRFPLCHPEALHALFEAGGLDAVETRAIDVPTVFSNFDDYWSPFLGGQGPAPSYVASLDEPARERLAARLREQLPVGVDGSIALVARAWAVRGARA